MTDKYHVANQSTPRRHGQPDSIVRQLCRRRRASTSTAKYLCLLVMALGVATASAAASPSPTSRPRALVYRGPASGPGLAEAVAQLLESSSRNFEVRYAGPGEATEVSSESLRAVEVYAQPGGPGTWTRFLIRAVRWMVMGVALVCSARSSSPQSSRHDTHARAILLQTEARLTSNAPTRSDLDDAWAETKAYAPSIRDFVSRGGRYLGFCLGAYLAGHTPGFGLLPPGADTDAENEQEGAQVTTDEDTIIQVDWTYMAGAKAGQTAKDQWVFFQEGAVIQGLEESETSFVLGRYSKSGGVAASLTKYGDGWVGLIGPHPEATREWCKWSAQNARYNYPRLHHANIQWLTGVAPPSLRVQHRQPPWLAVRDWARLDRGHHDRRPKRVQWNRDEWCCAGEYKHERFQQVAKPAGPAYQIFALDLVNRSQFGEF